MLYFALPLSDSQSPPILESSGPQASQKPQGDHYTHRSRQQSKQRGGTMCQLPRDVMQEAGEITADQWSSGGPAEALSRARATLRWSVSAF